ncbi:MAG: type sorting protein [Bacteroidetes bacterium]|nr:type sorting protein [Bacteroidota bacterium]
MKKIFTSVFAIALTSFAFGQSIHIFDGGIDVTGANVYDTVDASEATLHDLELHNLTSSAVNYKVNRTLVNPIDADASLYFCTGTQCYSPQTATTWTPTGPDATIAANSTLPSGPGTYGIAAHYDAGAMPSTLTVIYRVYNTGTSGDTAFVTIHYISVYAGIEENAKLAGGSIAAAYPNPASSIASIKYDMNQYAQKGKIVFYDMLGKKVKEMELSDKQGVVKVDVSEFNSGVYFYSFIVNDKAIATKKLVVSAR